MEHNQILSAFAVVASSSLFCLMVGVGLPRLVDIILNPKPPGRVEPLPPSYNVFISHRGPDVKTTLASSIYHWLQEKGLRVFLDKQEFRAGDPLRPTLEQAIRSASVHVVILSTNYAESSWCLEELSLILSTDAKIIPVFYGVKPGDLRRIEKGAYARAFDQHRTKRRLSFQILSKWERSLKEIADISGFEFHTNSNDDQGELVKRIGDSVLESVQKLRLEVPRNPVGLDEAIQDFQNFMERCGSGEHQNVKIVGIVGFGGSGKTTLATEFYNRKLSSFDRCSFLFNVRDHEKKLLTLQTRLLIELKLIDGKTTINSLDDGKTILRDGLNPTPTARFPRRFLIVLDDVDDENQMEMLLEKDVLGLGSVIILTSRERSALRKVVPKANIYKMKGLNTRHAQELLCMHAFHRPSAPPGFEELVAKFSRMCQGFPLFLKVMGAHLRAFGGEQKDYWKHEVRYIAKILSHDTKIEMILKVSYDKLHEEEKGIFLDIACFFTGEDKSLAVRIWDDSGWLGSRGLRNLFNKCLVEFDDDDRIKMQDHLRDFGRRIANENPPFCIWHPNQEIGSREHPKVVRGVMAATSDNRDAYFQCQSSYLPPLEEIELSLLKLLVIKGDCLPDRFGKLLTNLIWLRWYDCPHTHIPRWLSMKNLTVLELTGDGKLKELQLGNKELPLKELKIQGTALSKISIPHKVCPGLEHLDLSHNYRLTEVEQLPRALVNLCLKQ